MTRLYSSEAEHWSRKPGVVSSILTGGTVLFVTDHNRLLLQAATVPLLTFNRSIRARPA